MDKKGSCGAGKCGAGMMKKNEMQGDSGKKKMSGSCGAGKCGAGMMKKEKQDKCGCGMTIESCKKMMPSCEYRDAREAKEAKSK